MKPTNTTLSAPKKFEVEIGGQTYVIEKMPLGRYVELLGVMESLPQKLMEMFPDKNLADIAGGLEKMNMEEMLQSLPLIMKYATSEVINIVSIATRIPADVLTNDPDLGLDGFLDIMTMVMEINNFSKVSEQIKNVMSLRGHRA